MYVIDCSEPKTEQPIEGVGRASERVGALSLSPRDADPGALPHLGGSPDRTRCHCHGVMTSASERRTTTPIETATRALFCADSERLHQDQRRARVGRAPVVSRRHRANDRVDRLGETREAIFGLPARVGAPCCRGLPADPRPHVTSGSYVLLIKGVGMFSSCIRFLTASSISRGCWPLTNRC